VEAFLIDDWMRRIRATEADADVVSVRDQASLTVARDLVRRVGGESNAPTEVIDRALLVASELGTNHLRHARHGCIIVRPLTRTSTTEATIASHDHGHDHHGLEIIGMDRGTGISDVAAALDAPLARSASAPSLGVGIGSIVRLSTEVDMDVRREEGTFIAARLFGRTASGLSVVERRAEVGVYGRPFEHQPPSGDHASFFRDESRDILLLAIADGIGHGPQARDAAATAMRIFDRSTQVAVGAMPLDVPLDTTLVTMDEALSSTRGSVVTLARLSSTARSASARALDCCAVGNIETQVTSFRQSRRLRGSAGTVGQKRSVMSSATRALKPQQDSLIVARNEAIIFATDGVSSRCSIETDAALLSAHPIVIAQRIIESFGRDNDDALVAVIR
jgi:anti-sigma regulatory factor (Ser/Thr protein kinase)